jgi:nucleoid-associated protein YgaU
MITSTSRYEQKTAYKDDAAVNIASKKEVYVAKRTTTIVSVYGDTFDKIAARVLGDSTQYWKVAGLNPFIRFPDAIPVGTTIIVPLA